MKITVEELPTYGIITQDSYWNIISYTNSVRYEKNYSPAKLLADYSEEDIWRNSPAITPLDIRIRKVDGNYYYGIHQIYKLNFIQQGTNYMTYGMYAKDTLLNSGYYKIHHKHHASK